MIKLKIKPLSFEILIGVVIVILAWVVHNSNLLGPEFFGNKDIVHEYSTAMELRKGVNPYHKILEGDLLINRKYATLFPLYYYFIILISSFSEFALEPFLFSMQSILFISELVAALFLYLIFRRNNLRVLGLFAVLFFIFNRWTINTLADVKQDLISIAFIMASLYFLRSRTRLAFFLYGLSLGIKHLGIFILPFYFVPFIFKIRTLRETILDFSLFLVPIVGPAIPFLIDNAQSFIYSMIFSFTRKPATSSTPFGYDNLLILYNIGVKNNTVFFYLVPRIPLLIGTLFNLLLLVRKLIRPSFFLFSSIFVFIAFNPVLFDQYLTWVTPFIFLTGSSVLDLDFDYAKS